jgi:hypothetical protein
MKYTVFVDDNFHYMDEDERYKLGEFDTREEALAAAKKIIEEFLDPAYEPWMTAQEMYEGYVMFGEDPFIVPDDPADHFSAWDYAKERCAMLEKTGNELRRELEQVYEAVRKALREKDFKAFLSSVYGPEQAGDDVRAQFAEMAESVLEFTPELSQTTFVTIKTEGDDLAGYYHILRDEHFANILLTRFVRVAARWRLVLDSQGYSFQPKPGDDIPAKARELIKTEHSLKLERPQPVSFEAQPTTWDETVRAVLNCMAYDYEVKIAINGAPIDFTGGKSFSGILVGAAGGAPPAAPAVLQAGENRIDVEYRKTKDEEGPGLEVTINVLPEQLSFRLVAARKQSGKVSAKFFVPVTETEQVSPVEIDDDAS